MKAVFKHASCSIETSTEWLTETQVYAIRRNEVGRTENLYSSNAGW